MTFTALISRDKTGWYIAQCKELPGVITQGKTLRQVRSRFAEALEGHLQSLAELRMKGARTHQTGAVVNTLQFEVTASPV